MNYKKHTKRFKTCHDQITKIVVAHFYPHTQELDVKTVYYEAARKDGEKIMAIDYTSALMALKN
jgi:hypothetical protein